MRRQKKNQSARQCVVCLGPSSRRPKERESRRIALSVLAQLGRPYNRPCYWEQMYNRSLVQKGNEKERDNVYLRVCARMPETWFAHLATEDRRATANLPTHPSLIAKRYARQNPIHCWHQIAATQIPVWHVAAVGSLRIRESHRPRHVLPQGGDEPQLRACPSQWAQSINHSQYSDPGPSRVWGYIACCNHQIFR